MSRKSTQLFPVVEIFGPTIQGEGALAGVPSHFIRFGGCDYRCAWCDSAHAVLPELVRKAEKLDTLQIVKRVKALGGAPKWVTLSGGNPALLELDGVVMRLQSSGFKVAIETQGTMAKTWLQDLNLVTVSPKGPSSGNVTSLAVLDAFLSKIGGNPVDPLTALKVVVFDDADYEYAADVHQRFPAYSFFLSVGTYSGGLDGTWLTDVTRQVPGLLGTDTQRAYDTAETLSARFRWLSERVAADAAFGDVVVLPQLHYLAWGSEKGR